MIARDDEAIEALLGAVWWAVDDAIKGQCTEEEVHAQVDDALKKDADRVVALSRANDDRG